MTGMVTQCPKCLTSFRVTEAQLTIADGNVRCGSCLHIFSAPSHWLDEQSKTGFAAKITIGNILTFDAPGPFYK